MLNRYISRDNDGNNDKLRPHHQSQQSSQVLAHKDRPIDLISFMGNDEWMIDDTNDNDKNNDNIDIKLDTEIKDDEEVMAAISPDSRANNDYDEMLDFALNLNDDDNNQEIELQVVGNDKEMKEMEEMEQVKSTSNGDIDGDIDIDNDKKEEEEEQTSADENQVIDELLTSVNEDKEELEQAWNTADRYYHDNIDKPQNNDNDDDVDNVEPINDGKGLPLVDNASTNF
eukprot:CAMPEP_0201574380 /NCGR_PEP_ID=MMETSP0190_2-20130828/18819_1 /ASSEMBLY_ACC=CAM_ASM_000263 /TAXON_ID=37353 /ORGANISM="Rosalina sp." /LENGTH=227 /DNA_ID=CAMNT_0048002543 /DNA_START=827 /DNA_END=1510 /DNA_ORIENTATION=-